MIIIFVGQLLATAFAQNSTEKQFRIAQELYSTENYFDAITELKRLLFFDDTGRYKYSANSMIGESYKQGAKFSDAIRHFTLAEINSRNAEELYNSRIDIIRVNILRRTTIRALKLLDSLQADQRFKNNIDEINYWRGWAYIFADDWESAANSFAEIDSTHELRQLADKIDDELYSVSFAKTISYIIPGSGQIYTGEYISGLLSLGWNVLWGYLTIKAFIDERIFDGIVIANFLWLRFYRGNLQNAEKFAKEKNRIISNKGLYYLQYEYSGIKP
ncbi:MAG: hypothetical protein JSW63_08800 [Ignavibacterium sp.]|nr:MAG: hypothetical protein JSW63_08800 [Ignavibacterium sp.]